MLRRKFFSWLLVGGGVTLANAASWTEALPSGGGTIDIHSLQDRTIVSSVSDTDEIAITNTNDAFALNKLSIGKLKDYLFSSPIFTGIPMVPTAAVGTNTAQIASTAFVLANGAANSGGLFLEQTVVGNQSKIDITGLNLAVDKYYRIFFSSKNCFSGFIGYSFSINNTTPGYTGRQLSSGGTAINSAVGGNYLCNCNALNETIDVILEIFPSINNFVFLRISSYSSYMNMVYYNLIKTSFSGNLTSISFFSTNFSGALTAGISDGSTIKVFKA